MAREAEAPKRPAKVQEAGAAGRAAEAPPRPAEGGGEAPSPKGQGGEARKVPTAIVRFPSPSGASEASVSATQQVAASRWWLADADGYDDSASGYLMEIRYDGDLGKAVALVYDPSSGALKKVPDKTGHKPYFLTNIDLEDPERPPIDFSKYKSFSNLAVVTKRDPITNRDVKLTKVVVEDPLAVRTLRAVVKEKGYKVWEADIKYYLNYIYDNQLVPGMPYEVSTSWRRLNWRTSGELEDLIRREFAEDIKDMALEWVPFFEEPSPTPPMVAVDIEVEAPGENRFPDPSRADEPVISVALADSAGRRQVLLLYRPGSKFTGEELPDADVEIFDSERAMLLEVLRRLSRYVVVVTFNGDNFDLPYLANRLVNLGVNPSDVPVEFLQDYVTFRKALHVDLRKLFDVKALQVYAFGNKYREKNLDAIAEALLGVGKRELSEFINYVSLDELAAYNLQDSLLTIGLMTFDNMLTWNLVVLLMRISKMGLEEVTRSQVSAWIRSTLYWEHRRRGLLIPSREDIEAMGSQAPRSVAIIKDKKYRGAIVLQPPQGAFFNVVVLDFASLYPSVIRNWNLSYETVNNPYCASYVEVPEVGHRVCTDRRGISSQLVGLLRDFRVKIYKKKAKDKSLSEEERRWYDVVQAAMKVYINASYGVFGNEGFALYSLPVAESVTAIGRAVLLDTLSKASELNLHILYGDTDSLFIWNPPKEALEEIVRYVQEKHGMDLEIDKTFRLVLFSGLKKNYVGFEEDGTPVIKGMVAKKSNTPDFIKSEVLESLKILGSIREPQDLEKALTALRDKIQEIYLKLRRKEYTLDQLAIEVMLSKDPLEYKKNTPQHVKAALLLMKEGIQVGKGDVIAFVKTKDKLGVKPVRLARLSDVDTSKYLEYVRSAFEQFLMAFGVKWDELAGVRRLV